MKNTENAAQAANGDGARRGLSPDEIRQRDNDRAIDAAVLADAGGGSGWVCLSACLGCTGARLPEKGRHPK